MQFQSVYPAFTTQAPLPFYSPDLASSSTSNDNLAYQPFTAYSIHSTTSSVMNTPALETGEWTTSPFEGYTSSVPPMSTGETAISESGKKLAEVVGRRQRIAMACTYCRRRKIRCDGADVCSSCSRSGRTCEYTPVPLDEAKPLRVRRVPLASDDKRRMASSPYGMVPHSHSHIQQQQPQQQPIIAPTPIQSYFPEQSMDLTAGHAYNMNGHQMHGYVAPAPQFVDPTSYGGYSTIPAWTTTPVTPISKPVANKPFPSVLVSSPTVGSDHQQQQQFNYTTPTRPTFSSSSSMIFPASSPSESGSAESCACGGHSRSTSSGSDISISPPHTPIRTTVPRFGPPPIIDLNNNSSYFNAFPTTFASSSSSSSSLQQKNSSSARPPLMQNQFYLPYTPTTPFQGQMEKFDQQTMFPQMPFMAGSTTGHAGLVGLGITMPQGSASVFSGSSDRIEYQ